MLHGGYARKADVVRVILWANTDRSETRTISSGVLSAHIGSVSCAAKTAAVQQNRRCFQLLVLLPSAVVAADCLIALAS